jgi:hypothetical protein
LAVSLAALSFAAAGGARADSPCTGEACDALSVAADGCVWTNKSKKSVRLLLVAGETPQVVTVLAPGQSFKQADKAFCLSAGADRRYEASFAVLTKPAESKAATPAKTTAATPLPRVKPALEAVPAAGAAVASAGVASAPREKPELPRIAPPMPREKPDGPPVAAIVAKAPAAATGATAPLSSGDAVACDRDCPPILFKVIDDCLWVLNLNPRPVAFEADAGGKRYALLLEAADGAKADERAATLGNAKPPKEEASVHMRLQDPFQSAGSGIPVFRARLGAADVCVKSRADITRFWARYTR